MKKSLVSIVIAMAAMSMMAADIDLPAPQTTGGMSLMEAVANRKTTRKFSADKQLSLQQLSNLLWVADGFNRPDKLTIPTAMNSQEIILYVLRPDGAYRYDNRANRLIQVSTENLNPASAKQEFAQKCPLNIVIAYDTAKMRMERFANNDAGAVMQNIYLWCASEGINTVVRGMFGPDLEKALNMPENEKILLVQTVGFDE